MFVKIKATCPICKKNWTCSSEQEALDFEAELAQAPMYGVKYDPGDSVWVFGRVEYEVVELQLGKCALHKGGTYAHGIQYLVRRKNDGRELTLNWKHLLPVALADVEWPKRALRSPKINWENYWKLFPERVGYH